MPKTRPTTTSRAEAHPLSTTATDVFTPVKRKRPRIQVKDEVNQMELRSSSKRRLSPSFEKKPELAADVGNRQSPAPGRQYEASNEPSTKRTKINSKQGTASRSDINRGGRGTSRGRGRGRVRGRVQKNALVSAEETASDLQTSSNLEIEMVKIKGKQKEEQMDVESFSSSSEALKSAAQIPSIKEIQRWTTDDGKDAPMVWVKLAESRNSWAKVSLINVHDVYDLKSAIKAQNENSLKLYDCSTIVLKATKKLDDAAQAVEIDARKDLASVLKDFHIGVLEETSASVHKTFSENIYLFVDLPAPQATGTASRNDSFFLDGLAASNSPKDIFYGFLKGHHGNFLTQYIERNDPLPSFEPNYLRLPHKVKANPPKTLSGRPSLLLHNLPGNSTSASTTVTAALEAMERASKGDNLLIMLGTSGCGKTRTCLEILCSTWGIYFVAGKDSMGSTDIAFMETHLTPKLTQNFDANRSHAEHFTKCALLARLLILDHCVAKSPSFTPQRWMLIQVVQDIFLKIYDYNDDIFMTLTTRLATVCAEQAVREEIRNVYTKLYQNLKLKVFPIFLDEAQVLQNLLHNRFKSRNVIGESRPLLSPVVHALVQPADFINGHCVVPCGTGLGLMFIRDTLLSGIAKPVATIARFTDFGGWRDAEHVAQYARAIVDLKDADIMTLYQYFPGRFRPIATCIESILTGLLVKDAIDFTWQMVTTRRMNENENRQSLYYQLDGVVNRRRPNFVDSISVLELFKSVALSHFYAGSSHVFTNGTQMEIVELGLARLKTLPISNANDLKTNLSLALGQETDEDTLMESAGTIELASSFSDSSSKLVAIVDEPMALAALYNFFAYHNALSPDILTLMAASKDPSAQGTLWQRYLPDEFEAMFDGSKSVNKLPLLTGIPPKELPNVFKQTATIIRPSSPIAPVVKIASVDYKFEDYLAEDSSTRAAFFIPENLVGPDLAFFIKFRNGNIIPVFVQIKLRMAVHELEAALATTDPHLFYRDNIGEIRDGDRNQPVVKKVLDLCKKGVLRVLVWYPGHISITPHVRKYRKPSSRVTSGRHVVGIISKKTAHMIFRKEHVAFLDALKEVSVSAKRKYEDLETPSNK